MKDVAPGPATCEVVWLDRGETERALVGGKAASLSRLARLGARVPTAFALTTHAYAQFSDMHHLPVRVSDIDPGQLARLRLEILNAPMPESVAVALSSAYEELQAATGPGFSLAVRSSATAEDSAAFSFAGLHDTILDVRSYAALEAAVRQCWASLWSDRALSYRVEHGLDAEMFEIAVVVQLLVRSDVSFVVFTTDPVSQRDDRVVISATWGLGEAIVSGLVVPDHIVVSSDGQILEYAVGAKHVMVIPGTDPDNGSREVPVPRMLQTIPALSPEQVSMVAATAIDLANRLGFQSDFEGGIAGGEIFFFQARPITTLG